MRPVVITFYSYKGGVGRTLLAANMALALARHGKTLLWDFDAEAPGLHRIKALRTGASVKSGYFDWLIAWQKNGRNKQLGSDQLENFSNLLYPTAYTDFTILPAIGDEADASELYFAIDWNYLLVDEPDRGRGLFNALIDYLGSIGYRHILLDSRTGLTDLAGMVAGIIADATVLVGNYGAQNLHGLGQIHRALIADTPRQRSLRGKDAALKLFYIASPIPQDDAKLVAVGRELWARAFELELASVHEIRYDSELPFSEGLLIRDLDRGIAKDYQRFADVLGEFIDTVMEQESEEQRQMAQRADILADKQDPRLGRATQLRFDQRIAGLLRLLGYTLEAGVGGTSTASDEQQSVDYTARIESAFDTLTYLVDCKDRIASVPKKAITDLALALARPEARAMQARGMVVARSFSPAALTHAKDQGIQALTLEELERKLLDFGPYLNKIIADFEQMPLAAAYVVQRARTGNNGNSGNIADMTLHGLAWAQGQGSRLWVLLGDYGTGKTAYTQKLEYEMAKLARKDGAAPVPMRINLRDIPNKVSLEEVLAEHWQRSTRQRKDPKILLHLIARGRIVLLLDSFDEMGLAASGRSVVEQFRALVHISADGGISDDQGDKRAGALANRVLITCREQFFRDHGEAASIFADRDADGVSVLHGVAIGLSAAIDTVAMFDQGQIVEFLNKRLGRAAGAAAWQFLEQQHLQELGDRPQLLDIIIQSLPALKEREAKDGQRLRTGTLYQIYTNRWLDDFKPMERQSTSAQLRSILEVLAQILWQREGNRIHYVDLYALLKNRSDLRGKLDPNQLDIELRTAAFLSRTPDGMYGFSHSSFLEYFFAERIVRAASAASGQTVGVELGEVLDVPCLSREICAFANDLAAVGDAAGTRDALRAAVKAVLQEGRKTPGIEATALARANALWLAYRIAHAESEGAVKAQQDWIPARAWLAGVDLSGMDFSGLWAEQADLSGALLEGTVLRDAVLTGAVLTQAKLARADLRGADAREADLQDADCSDCIAGGVRLDGALARRACWVNAQLDGAGLARTDFSGADMRTARLARARGVPVLDGARVQGTTARGALWAGYEALTLPPLARLILVPFGGHACAVNSLAYSPDGRRIASGGMDGMWRLWDEQSAKLLLCKGPQGKGPISVAMSTDGLLLASAGGAMVKLWDTQNGEFLSVLPGEQSSNYRAVGVAFDGSGHRLAMLEDHMLHLWDTKSGKSVYRKPTLHMIRYWWKALDFSLDGRFVATAGEQNVKLWDAKTGETLHNFPIVGSPSSLRFSADGRQLAVAGLGGLHSWDTESKKECLAIDGRHSWDTESSQEGLAIDGLHSWDTESRQKGLAIDGDYRCLAFSPNGQQVIAGDVDGSLSMWDAQSGKPLRKFQAHKGDVWRVAFRPDGEQFCSAGRDGRVYLWDVKNAKRVRTLDDDRSRLSCLAFSLDGCFVLCASAGGMLALWDVQRGTPPRILQGHLGTIASVALSDDKQILLSGGDDDGMVRLWDGGSGQQIRQWSMNEPVSCVALSGKNTYVAAGGANGALCLWDRHRQKDSQLLMRGARCRIISLVFSPDEKLLASADKDKNVSLWDTQNGKLLPSSPGNQGQVTALAFSPDGQVLAIATNDGIILWDIASSKPFPRLDIKQDRVLSMAFSGDGQQLISVGRYNTVVVWQVKSGEHQDTDLPDGSIHHASVSASGQLATIGGDGRVHIHGKPAVQTTADYPLEMILYASEQPTSVNPVTANAPAAGAASWYSVDFRQDRRGLWRGEGAALAALTYRDKADTLQPWPWLPRDWRAEDLPELAARDIADIAD